MAELQPSDKGAQMLTLKDFVKETLTEIVDAVTEFSTERGETGATANPPFTNAHKEIPAPFILGEYHPKPNRHDLILPVAFDVAVAATDSTTAKGGTGISVLNLFKADGSIESDVNASRANRVQFTLPLRLPNTGSHGQPIEPVNPNHMRAALGLQRQ